MSDGVKGGLLQLGVALMLCWARQPLALMAGTLPDTPSARVVTMGMQSDWNSAGVLLVNESPFTGVVVAKRYVLTAAHVTGREPPGHVRFVLTPGSHPRTFEAAAVVAFPGTSFPYDDLALVRLKQAVPAWVKIYPIYVGLIRPGQRITFIGAGGSGNGDRGVSVGAQSSILRKGENVIDAVSTAVDKSGRVSSFYLYDFDGPAGSGPLGGPSLGNGIETMVVAGDSGSPVFARIAGRTWLLGINTLGAAAEAGKTMDSKFGNIGGGMLLSYPPFVKWIQSEIRR